MRTFQRLVACGAVILLVTPTLQAQELSPEVPLPPFCHAACQRYYYADLLERESPERQEAARVAAQKIVAKAQAIPDTYKNIKRQADIQRYGSVILDTAIDEVSSLTTLQAGTKIVLKTSLKALEDNAERLQEQYEENILQATYRLVHEALGTTYLNDDGTINRDELIGGGIPQIFNSAVFERAPPALREVLRDERANLNLLISRDTNLKVQDMSVSLDAYGNRLGALKDAVYDLKKSHTILQKTALSTASAVKELRIDVANQGQLIAGLITSTLSPREQLALAQKGLLRLETQAKQRLMELATAADIQETTGQITDILSSSARALAAVGVDSDVTNALVAGASLVKSGGEFAAAITTGGTFEIAKGALNLLGTLFGLGGKSNEGLAWAKMFDELRDMREEIRSNHKETMKKLDEIQGDLTRLGEQLHYKLDEILDIELENQSILTALLTDTWKVCKNLEADRSKLFMPSLKAFNTFLQADRYRRYQDCLDWMDVRIAPAIAGKQALLFFLEMQQPTDSSLREARARMIALREGIFRPTRCFSERYNEDFRNPNSRQSVYGSYDYYLQETLSSSTAPTDAAVDHCARSTDFMIQPGTLLEMLPTARELVMWKSVIVQENPAKGEFVLDARRLSECDASCVASSDSRVENIIKGLQSLTVVALEQERILAGASAAGPMSSLLDSQVVPKYYASRYALDGEQLRAEFKSLPQQPPERLIACTTGISSYDVLCLMQANPFAAENALRAFVSKRLARTNTSLADYASALESPLIDRLQAILGKDVFLRRSSSNSPTLPTAQWVIELPRVIIPTLPTSPNSQAFDLVVSSCWDNYPRPVRQSDWANVAGSGLSRDQARCYALPSPPSLIPEVTDADGKHLLSLTGRAFLTDLPQWKMLMEATALDLGLASPEANSVPVEVERALSFNYALAEARLRDVMKDEEVKPVN